MLSDRFTAKVLGLLVLVLAVLIDISFFMFSKPEAKQNPSFPIMVIGTSLPIFVFGAVLLYRGSRMKDDEKR